METDLKKPHIYIRGKAINEKVAYHSQELFEALNKIWQMSDPGSHEEAVIEMKHIAGEAIKKATE